MFAKLKNNFMSFNFFSFLMIMHIQFPCFYISQKLNDVYFLSCVFIVFLLSGEYELIFFMTRNLQISKIHTTSGVKLCGFERIDCTSFICRFIGKNRIYIRAVLFIRDTNEENLSERTSPLNKI